MNPALAFFRRAEAHPEHPALHVDGRVYSYGELALHAGRVAAWLRAHSNDEPRVGLLCGRSALGYAGLLGTAAAGGAYVPLNPAQPPARLLALCEKARLDAVILDEEGAAALTPELRARVPQLLHPGDADSLAPTSPVESGADSLAYIIFTSGTTGVPKGVMITAGNLHAFTTVMQERYRFSPDDRVLQISELSFDLSVLPVYAAFGAGATLYVVPERIKLAPAGYLREHAITIWVAVPSAITFLSRLRQLPAGAFPSLRASIFCGEALPLGGALAWQAAAPNSVVDNQYGPTEATCSCMLEPFAGEASATPGRGVVAIGRAYAGMHSAIVDSNHQFLPTGQVGELALSGAQVMAGYFDEPALTAQRCVNLTHPTLGESRWYLTGDSAMEDERGVFHHLGRIDNQVKVRGYRIELEEVDAHLRRICGTDLVATVGWPIEDGAVVGLTAFVSGGALDESQIRERLSSEVAAYLQPRRIIKLPELPLSANGKIDRRALVDELGRLSAKEPA